MGNNYKVYDWTISLVIDFYSIYKIIAAIL
nr:MAG TPA: hypothetical protein [Crassvirales sp.]